MPNAHVEPVELKADARGVLLEPIDAAALAVQRNSHLVLTLPGAIRGNHYHERGTEIAVVLGPALVRLREEGAVRDIGVPYGDAYRFVIPPGVTHAFKGTGSAPLVMVSFNSEVHDPVAPDVIRDTILD